MPNAYATLKTLKAELGMPDDPARDETLMRTIEDVSRAFEEMRGTRGSWHWYPATATRFYDSNGRDRLELPTWLSAITALTVDADGDGVFELAPAETVDYWLYPLNTSPKRTIIINPESVVLSAFPSGRRRVSIEGTFGWSDDSETVLTNTGGAVLLSGAISDIAATAVTLDGGHSVSVGDTLLIEAEQLYVRAVEGTTVTVTRGENGTTAATHADDTAVSRVRYAHGIERATIMQAARLFRQTQDGFAGGIGPSDFGGPSFTTLFPAIQDAIRPYFDPAVA